MIINLSNFYNLVTIGTLTYIYLLKFNKLYLNLRIIQIYPSFELYINIKRAKVTPKIIDVNLVTELKPKGLQ